MANIVITGASRGIGMATALVLARAGHHVVATMRNAASNPELGQIAKSENLPIRIEAMDVDSDASVNACFANVNFPRSGGCPREQRRRRTFRIGGRDALG